MENVYNILIHKKIKYTLIRQLLEELSDLGRHDLQETTQGVKVSPGLNELRAGEQILIDICYLYLSFL